MATKSVKSYKKKARKTEKKLFASFDSKNYEDASRKAHDARKDAQRAEGKKPARMSKAEWSRQVKSGEAKVQNLNESDLTQEVRAGLGLRRPRKKTKEFTITTMREPKRKRAKARKARPDAKRGKR